MLSMSHMGFLRQDGGDGWGVQTRVGEGPGMGPEPKHKNAVPQPHVHPGLSLRRGSRGKPLIRWRNAKFAHTLITTT